MCYDMWQLFTDLVRRYALPLVACATALLVLQLVLAFNLYQAAAVHRRGEGRLPAKAKDSRHRHKNRDPRRQKGVELHGRFNTGVDEVATHGQLYQTQV